MPVVLGKSWKTLLRKRIVLFKYWICSECGVPRRMQGPGILLKRCKQCRSRRPSYIRITPSRKRKHIGDICRDDTRWAEAIYREANRLKHESGLLRKGAPERELPARKLIEWAGGVRLKPLERQKDWLCQIWFDGVAYIGYLPHEICFTQTVEEVVEKIIGTQMTQLRLPIELHTWLKTYAAKQNTTMREIVIYLLTQLKNAVDKSVKTEQI